MNNKKQRNRLFTMLLLVMAILMPYEGHGHKHQRRLPKVMAKKTILTSSPKLRSWRGSAMR